MMNFICFHHNYIWFFPLENLFDEFPRENRPKVRPSPQVLPQDSYDFVVQDDAYVSTRPSERTNKTAGVPRRFEDRLIILAFPRHPAAPSEKVLNPLKTPPSTSSGGVWMPRA